MSVSKEPLIQMRNIHLILGGITVLSGVDFQLNAGEIHALIGERRSGKTSLMRILTGEIQPDIGMIFMDGQPVTFPTPHKAADASIWMVHQKLLILPTLNAVENIYIRTMPKVWLSFHQYGTYVRKAEQIFKRMGQEGMNLAVPVGTLPIAQQQSVEIARIMAQNPRVVILDEIAERRSKAEMERLFQLMEEFRCAGTSIVYITDNINEVFEIADRVTVLADGHRKSTENVKNLDRLKLVRMAFNLALDQQNNAVPVVLRQFNESVIRNLPVGVLIFDQEDRLFHANEEAERLCRRSQIDLAGVSLEDILLSNMVHYREEILDAVKQNAKHVWEGVPFGSAEFTRIQTDTIQDENYNTLGRILLVQDATLDQTVVEYLARAEKMESTAEIAAGVAHEINNPLATIRNYVEILRIRNTEADTGDKLERISGELNHIVEIISSLLSFSKVYAENREPVNVQELLRETVTLLGHRFKKKHIAVRFATPHLPVVIQADENRLKQVLINILVNSIEAVLDGGEVVISLKFHPEQGKVAISIKDDGNGIPELVLKKIFHPFYSTKASRTNTGLGLSICKHIVESHGGTITIESVVGTHTTVRVCLPLSTTKVE